MSHFTKLKTQVKDLEAMKRVLDQLLGVPCPDDSNFIGKYFIGVASELNKFKDCEGLGELVFLANGNAVFHHRIA